MFLKLGVSQLQDLRLQLILAAYLAISATATAALRLRRQAPALLLGLGLIVVPWLPWLPEIMELEGHVWILKSSRIQNHLKSLPVEVPFIPMSNLFFLVGTTIGERLLYPLTVGWALVLAGLGFRSHGTRMGGCLKLASISLLAP